MNKHFCPYCMTPVEEGAPCPSCGLTAGAYNPSPHHLPPGTILMDRYMVGRVLGEGGFGITYIGCDLRLELKVAIKEYFPTDKVTRHARASLDVASYVGTASIGYEEGKIRFLNEARTMARMDKQPEIVSVRDFFEDHNTAYIVMEYVNGTTFKELVGQKGGRIPPEELLPMMEPLFSALTAMHQQGLIHRDISPDNLMLEKGALRLLDFGCARESARGTETMTIALKHGYAPIEQYQHKGQGPWTDVYALSATMYYCLTGKTPPQALDRLCEDELILPRKLGINITERQEKALLYGMGIRPRRRFQSVEELHAALYIPDGAPVPEPDDEEPPIRLLPEEPSAPSAESEELPVEEVVSRDETASVETTVPAEEITGEAEPVTETVSDRKNNLWEENILPFLRKNTTALAAGTVAVVFALTLIISLWPKETADNTETGDNTNAATDVTTPSDDGGSQPEQSGEEQEAGPFANAVTLSVDSEIKLRALMENDDVSAVILNSHILLTGEELVVTKPLRIAKGHGLNFFAPITVGPGGHIEVDAEMCCDALLRTAGGSINVTSTGFITGAGILWLEDADDLVMDEGGRVEIWGRNWSPTNSDHYLTVNEDTIFENAAHVHSIEEFYAANDDWSAASIVIASDITLPESVTSSKPVLISEGVTVTAGKTENHDFGNCATWCVDGALFVNRGTFTGSMNLGNWSGGYVAVVNYGTVDASLHMDCEGTFINYGELISSDAHVPSTIIVNLGTIRHTGETDARFMDIADSVFNHGEMIVSGEGCSIAFANGNIVFNSGSITAENHGALYVEAQLINSGTIHICDTTTLDGSGHIEQTTKDAALRADSGANVPFCGLLTYNLDSVVELPEESSFTQISFDWCNSGYAWDAVCRVANNEQQLRSALDDPDCAVIFIDRALEITGDWTFNKGIAVSGSLTVHDGSLTLSGGYMISGDTRVENGAVIVEEGGVWLNRSELTCEELIVRSGGNLVNNGWINDVDRISIDGGILRCVTGGIDLVDRQIHVENGLLLSLSHLSFQGCEIVIGEGGDISSFNGNCSFGSQCRIENRGRMSIHGWEWQEMHLDVDMTNYGELSLADGAEFSGSLVNRGIVNVHGFIPVNGTIENRGEIINHYGKLYALDGEITGKAPVNP